MFRFEHPIYLYLMLLLPLIVIFYLYSNYRRRKRIREYGDPQLMAELMPEVSKYRPDVKFWLLFSCLPLMLFMLARPQFGSRVDNTRTKGAEIMIVMDISKSMWAEDVQPSRLEKAKRLVEQLINKLNNDKIGLITFAGDAYVLAPMTNDFISAKMFLQNADPSLMTDQGTEIGKAIDLATNSFTPKSPAGKAIILITDGENLDGDVTAPLKEAQKKGIQVNVVGVGLPEGAPIPIPGTDNFIKYQGETVISKLNEKMCENIASEGHGVYVRLDNSNNAEKVITATVGRLKKVSSEVKIYSDYDEQFQYVGWIVLLLLFVELTILGRKNKRFKNIHLFSK